MKILTQLFTALSLLALPMISYSQNIIDFAGNFEMGYGGDGYPATSGFCELYQPAGVYADKFGNTYIDDCLNNVIRKVNTNGIISTFAGIRMTGYGGYYGDGGPATDAELNLPEDVCGDSAGNIFIADYDNGVIRKVNTSGIITTVVGSGYRGFYGDGGPATAAELYFPVYVFVDKQENIYISDLDNSRIRKVNVSGIISTIAGNGVGGNSGDGGDATAAELGDPSGITIDSVGNLYISVAYGEIRKVNTSGIISTIAGNGITGYTGDGGPATDAELNFPLGLCFDASGNLLFCDGANNRIRKVNTSGIISTIAGYGNGGYIGDGGPATAAELHGPWGITINQYGNVCFSDEANNVVREIVYYPTGIENISDNGYLLMFPNPTTQELNLLLNKHINGLATLSIIDITGRMVFACEKNITNDVTQIDVSFLSSGIYFLNLTNKDMTLTKKFIKQ